MATVRKLRKLGTDAAQLDVLSARQREVCGLVMSGLSDAEIARRLNLSETTVKNTLHSAHAKLGLATKRRAGAPGPSGLRGPSVEPAWSKIQALAVRIEHLEDVVGRLESQLNYHRFHESKNI